MLHFDHSGRLLDAPVSLPGVRSPQNPTLAAGESPTLDRSKGFEAAAVTPSGQRAFVFLEGALLADPDQRRRYVYELDLDSGRFTGRRWAYRTENPAWLVADAKALDGRRLLVMERDDFEGTQAVFKRVYEIELSRADEHSGAAARTTSSSTSASSSTCSPSATPTASPRRPSRATGASATRSRSCFAAWRASCRSTTGGCSSPTTTTSRSMPAATTAGPTATSGSSSSRRSRG